MNVSMKSFSDQTTNPFRAPLIYKNYLTLKQQMKLFGDVCQRQMLIDCR